MPELSEEHELLRESVRALAEDKIAPHAAAVDETGAVPRGRHWPRWSRRLPRGARPGGVRRRGGRRGVPRASSSRRSRAAARPSSLIPAVNKLGTMGDPAPAARSSSSATCPQVACGEAMFSYALSEPEAGSDAAAMRCRAVRRRRRLAARRGQALDHQRRRLALLHGDGGDRPGGRRARHLGVRRARGRRRLHPRRPGAASSASRARRPASCTSTRCGSRPTA